MQSGWLRRMRVRVLLPVGLVLVALLAVWMALAPAEARLGNLIKLVYLHGALVFAGLAAFSLAGSLGLVGLVARRAGWRRGASAVGLGALLVWILYTLSSMAVTRLAWGQLVAWSEPRVRVTALILGAAVVIEAVVRLVNHSTFEAVARAGMGIVPWVATRQADLIRHPADPIGGSGSAAIQVFFVLIVLTVAGLVLDLFAWLWIGKELSAETPQARNGGREGEGAPCETGS